VTARADRAGRWSTPVEGKRWEVFALAYGPSFLMMTSGGPGAVIIAGAVGAFGAYAVWAVTVAARQRKG
jgi:hypothetical protein